MRSEIMFKDFFFPYQENGGKCISGGTLLSASLFSPLLRLYWSTLSSSEMPKSLSLPRDNLVCGYTAWAALPKSLLKYSRLDHKCSCICKFQLAVLLTQLHVGGFQHCVALLCH